MESIAELIVRDIMTTLSDSHRYALDRRFRVGDLDKDQYDLLAQRRRFSQKGHFFSNWIGEDRLEDETFSFRHQGRTRSRG